MKLRQLPTDFKVEEINDLQVSKDKGSYRLYLVEKKGLEAFYLLNYLAKKNNIPRDKLAVAGLKDKHAVTKQYLTIPSRYEIKTLSEDNFSIEFLGFVDRELEIGGLSGNRFEITARDIRKGEQEGIRRNASAASDFGVPNYFDSQRFGSAVKKEFIAKYIIKKDYEQAARIFLTSSTKFENSRIKQDKKLIAEHWSDLSKINLKNPALARVVRAYLAKKSWLEAYKKIPWNLREMFISAYQSYLWNECVKELLKTAVDKNRLYSIEYAAGSLLFYKRITDAELSKLPEKLSTISSEVVLSGAENEVVEKILKREGMELAEFDIMGQTGSFFKSHERQVIVKPAGFKAGEFYVDQLNDSGKSNRFRITLSFSLPKGSYATIITKRVFNS